MKRVLLRSVVFAVSYGSAIAVWAGLTTAPWFANVGFAVLAFLAADEYSTYMVPPE
jgi:hypothetical protein